jgi:Cu+-exporting ATPase
MTIPSLANHHDPIFDPVCGVSLDPKTAPHHYNFRDNTYYFCSGNCLKLFLEDPDAYIEFITSDEE